jgi:hypothetical protein
MVVDMTNEDELIEKLTELQIDNKEKLANFSESKRLQLQIRRKEFYLITEKIKELNLELEEIRLQIKDSFKENEKNEKLSLAVFFGVILISSFFDPSDKTFFAMTAVYVLFFLVHFLNKRITQTSNFSFRDSRIDLISNYKFLLRKSVGTPYLHYEKEYIKLINEEVDDDEMEPNEKRLIKAIYDTSLTSAIIRDLTDDAIYNS